MNKLKPYILILIISLLLEIVIFNFSSIISLGNKKADLSTNTTIEFVDNGYVLHIDNLDMGINNLYFDMNVSENSPVDYAISMTDEGNYYDYYMPVGTVYSTVPSSFYTNLHPYGKVHSLTVTFTLSDSAFKGPFTVNGITANVKRPLFFNIARFLILFVIISLMYLLRDKGIACKVKLSLDKASKEYKIQLGLTILVIIFTAFIGYFCSSSHKLFDESTKPHHQQYKELAQTLLNGEVALPDEPSEGLLNAPNPYDSIYLQANGIEYKADYAYYNGSYYVYFGIVPEVLLYLPYRMIMGDDLPNHFAVFVFYALFVTGTFMFLRKICQIYFKDISFAAYLLCSFMICTASTFAYIFFTADLYSVPIMAGLGLTMMGLYFWMEGIAHKESANKMAILYFLGSLCMALVSGCRPQLLLFSALALPLFWNVVIKDRQLFSKGSIGRTASICIPYVLVAIGVMYYNFLRFGSVLDFGATYSLTNNDMNLRGVSISRMLLGLFTFLFQVPYFNGVFPFLHTTDLSYSYMGRIVVEHFYGGIISTNLVCWPIFAGYRFKTEIKTKGIGLLMLLPVGISLVIGLLDANAAGVLQRYSADMALGIYFSAVLIIFIWYVVNPKNAWMFIKIAFITGLLMTLLMICNVDSGITLKMYNPELFGQIGAWFRL